MFTFPVYSLAFLVWAFNILFDFLFVYIFSLSIQLVFYKRKSTRQLLPSLSFTFPSVYLHSNLFHFHFHCVCLSLYFILLHPYIYLHSRPRYFQSHLPSTTVQRTCYIIKEIIQNSNLATNPQNTSSPVKHRVSIHRSKKEL